MPVKSSTTRHVRYEAENDTMSAEVGSSTVTVRVTSIDDILRYSGGAVTLPYDEFVAFADAVRLAHAEAQRGGC